MNEKLIFVYHEGMHGHFELVVDMLHSNLSSIHPLWNHDHENNNSSLHEDMKTYGNVLEKKNTTYV
jgi:hypothetical protein